MAVDRLIDYTVGPSQTADLDALGAIETTCARLFDEHPITAGLHLSTLPPKDYRKGHDRGLLWVARHRTEGPVGMAMAVPLGADLHLEELDVLPSHGRRGVGAALVEEVLCAAHERGYPRVTLCTFRSIPWNAPYYRRLGFRALRHEEWSRELRAIVTEESQLGLARRDRVIMGRPVKR